MRPCLGLPDHPCAGLAAHGARCPRCTAEWERQRRPSPDARYGPRRKVRHRAAARGSCQLRLPGCTGRATTADHPIAVSRGGARDQLLVPACASCNRRKGAR